MTLSDNATAEQGDGADCDTPDPDDLGRCCPAVVLRSGHRERRTLVADAEIVTEGWLRTTDWSGQDTLYPPETIEGVRKVEIERVREGELSVRIADADLREEAREKWLEAVEDRQVVSADD